MKHYRIFVSLMLAWFLSLPSASAEIEPLWAKTTSKASSNSVFYSVALGNDSNLYTAGYMYGDDVYNFGNRITASSDSDGIKMLLVKYNNSGSAELARTAIVAPNLSEMRAFVPDTSENKYYAAGRIYGTGIFDFGNTVRTQGDYSYDNAVLIKYDADGNALWAKSPTVSPNSSMFYSAITDNNGTIYTSGLMDGNGVYNFGNGVTVNGSAPTSYNCILVKYDSSGNTVWAKSTLSGSDFSFFSNVAVDNSGNVYTSGYVSGNDTYNFGNGVTITGSSLESNLVLIKYDSDGNAEWGKSIINSSGSSYAYDVALDNSGNIYLAGQINGNTQFDFGNGVKINGSYASKNALLVKYDSSGNTLWAKSTVSSINRSVFHSLAIDNDGNIYTVGEIYGNEYFDFGNDVTVTGSHEPYQNLVLVKYDSNGNTKWAKSTKSGSDISRLFGVTVDGDGNIYVSGYCVGNKIFDLGNEVKVKGDSLGFNVLLVKYGTVAPSSSNSSSSSGPAPAPSSSSDPSPEVSSGTKTNTKLSTIIGIGSAVIASI